jgi:hypothetical protein
MQRGSTRDGGLSDGTPTGDGHDRAAYPRLDPLSRALQIPLVTINGYPIVASWGAVGWSFSRLGVGRSYLGSLTIPVGLNLERLGAVLLDTSSIEELIS